MNILILSLFVSSATAKEKYQQPRPVRLDHDGEKWAQKALKKMPLEEKVGQLFMVWARVRFMNVASPDYLQLREQINKYHVGGFAVSVPAEGGFVYKNEPYEAAVLLNQLQQDSKLPLIFAADFERGLSMRLYGTTVFPHAMAFGADRRPEDAEAFGRITADEARAVGVQWNFFPDADVNSNPANPIINTRSFGEDPKQVGDLLAAYIHGAREDGMMTTAKHFPGHGDTDTDSHLGLARVGGDLNRLQSVELPPFRRAIASGVDSIMVAHVSAPALEPDPNRVATTSPAVVSDLLQKQLGFKGIVVTDAMDMGALTRLYANDIGRGAVDALKAGNDLILIPVDLDASYNAVLKAVRSGEIPEARIDASVLKLLQAKASVGLDKARLVDINHLTTVIGKPENLALGQQIADRAVTLVRDNGQVLPMKATVAPNLGTTGAKLPYQPTVEVTNRVVVVIFSDDMRSESGRLFEREFRARVPEAHIFYVDSRTAGPMTDEIITAVDQADAVVLPLYVVPTAGKAISAAGAVKNSVELPDSTGSLLARILTHAGPKTAVLAMGNPYLAADFPRIENYLCTFSNATVSELSAVKALFGEIPISGRLPVSIPGIAQRGTGIDRPVRAAGEGQHAIQGQLR
ncbi:MAG TPA: glycoside hydrolase family 3 protein [Terriglobales bacterium]|nr:glycoside hydrolase family 3 protein [Terriglobales bacterium]